MFSPTPSRSCGVSVFQMISILKLSLRIQLHILISYKNEIGAVVPHIHFETLSFVGQIVHKDYSVLEFVAN